jgi:hypothetical protein
MIIAAESYCGPEVRLEEMPCYGPLLALRSPLTPFVDRDEQFDHNAAHQILM